MKVELTNLINADLEFYLLLFSAISFIFFGISCFIGPYFKSEFERYGLPQFRKLTGFLQLVGGLGILFGFFWNPLSMISTAGLSVLMLLGFGVRIKIKDSVIQSFPSFFYFALNAFLFLSLIKEF